MVCKLVEKSGFSVAGRRCNYAAGSALSGHDWLAVRGFVLNPYTGLQMLRLQIRSLPSFSLLGSGACDCKRGAAPAVPAASKQDFACVYFGKNENRARSNIKSRPFTL